MMINNKDENNELRREKKESILSNLMNVMGMFSIISVVFLVKCDINKCSNLIIATILFALTFVLASLVAIYEIKLNKKPIEGMYGGWIRTVTWTIFLFIGICDFFLKILEHCWK